MRTCQIFRTHLTLLITLVFLLQTVAMSARGLGNSGEEPMATWVRPLQQTPISAYFPGWLKNHITVEEKNRLFLDLEKLIHEYKKDNFTEDDQHFLFLWLQPYIEKMNPQRLRQRLNPQTRLLAQMTVDELLAVQLWQYWASKPESQTDPRSLYNRLNHATEEKEFKGMSPGALALLVIGAISVGRFLLSTGWMLFVTAPLTSVTNAATDPVIRPITEKIRTIGQTHLGWISVRLNNWLNQKGIAEATGGQSGRVIAANPYVHNTNFGGMTTEDQRVNLPKLQQVWTKMELRYGQMFTETMRLGRTHLDYVLAGEVYTGQAVRLLNMAMQTERLSSEMILNRVLAGQSPSQIAHIQSEFEFYQNLFELDSLEQLSVTFQENLLSLAAQMEAALADLGFTTRDLKMIRHAEMTRRGLRLVKATILAIQNVLDFGRPEANRNAEEAVQKLWINVRHFSGLQEQTEDVGRLVQEILRTLGMRISGPAQVKPLRPAEFYQCLENDLQTDTPNISCETTLFEGEGTVGPRPAQSADDIEALVQSILNDPHHDLYGWVVLFVEPDRRKGIARLLAKRSLSGGLPMRTILQTFINSVRLCANIQIAPTH